MKHTLALVSLLTAMAAHADVTLSVSGPDKKNATYTLQLGERTAFYTVTNAQGEKATLYMAIERERDNGAVVRFTIEAQRLDGVRKSRPIIATLPFDGYVPVSFDVVPGGLIVHLKLTREVVD